MKDLIEAGTAWDAVRREVAKWEREARRRQSRNRPRLPPGADHDLLANAVDNAALKFRNAVRALDKVLQPLSELKDIMNQIGSTDEDLFKNPERNIKLLVKADLLLDDTKKTFEKSIYPEFTRAVDHFWEILTAYGFKAPKAIRPTTLGRKSRTKVSGSDIPWARANSLVNAYSDGLLHFIYTEGHVAAEYLDNLKRDPTAITPREFSKFTQKMVIPFYDLGVSKFYSMYHTVKKVIKDRLKKLQDLFGISTF